MALTTYKQDYLPGFAPCEAANKRKVKMMKISRGMMLSFLGLFQDGTRRYKVLGIPPDAQVVAMSLDTDYPANLILHISSCSFDEVPLGSPYPYMDSTVSVTTDFYPVPNSEYYYMVTKSIGSEDGNRDQGDIS